MRVVVPFARLHVTEQVLRSYRVPVEFVRLDDDDAYRRLLHELWAARETVVIVEQDIVPWPGALEELYGCMGLWCACAHPLFGGLGIYHGLGCTKISGQLMARLPDLWDLSGHWSTLDQRLYFAARDIGEEPHPHRPPVIHLGAHAEARQEAV